jgi:hypothetical protein
MSALIDRIKKGRSRPTWRGMSREDLVVAVRAERGDTNVALNIDWESMLFGFLRDNDEALLSLDFHSTPTEGTKRAVARALKERISVPPDLLAWLGAEILEPAKKKRGRRPMSFRNHELRRLVKIVHENTNLPIDDASHFAPDTAIAVVAEVFGMEQSTAFEAYYDYNRLINIENAEVSHVGKKEG